MMQVFSSLSSAKYSREKISFVFVNILVSSMAFLKSFIFMKYLGLYDLGILTIIQTIMMSIGLLQMGFLNGGYRIYSIGIGEDAKNINNQIFTFIGILSAFLILVWICLIPFRFEISKFLILFGIILGILSLTCNWLTNALIAKQSLKRLNRFNIFSTLLSLLLLPLTYWYTVYGAVLVLLVQPTAFILLCFIYVRELKPTTIKIDWNQIRNIMKYGFIPFLTGIFVLLTNQLERWSILGWLGTENLGKFYLVFLFSSFYILIPGSLNNLFFPDTMKLYRDKGFSEIRAIFSKYYFLLTIYIFVAFIITAIFLNPLVEWLLPAHSEGVRYVYYVLPGLIIISLSEPIGLLFNASVILRPMFWAYFSSVLLYIILILFLFVSDELSLGFFAILRSIISIYIFIFFLLSYFRFKKLIWIQEQ